MALTLREKMVLEAVRRLQGITLDNGYSRDIKSVERRSEELPDSPPLPSIFVYELTEEKDDGYAFGHLRCDLDMVVVYLAEVVNDKRATINEMLGDITKAMQFEYLMTDVDGHQTEGTFIERMNEVKSNQAIDPIVQVGVKFTVRYTHLVGDQTRV